MTGRTTADHPLAENQRFLAELAQVHPGSAQHSSVIEVGAGRHGPADEVSVLRDLGRRHEALRLQVTSELDRAVLAAETWCETIEADDLAEAHACARTFLEGAIDLEAEPAWQFQVITVRSEHVSHLLVGKVHHVALDAESRFTFLSDRHALLDGRAASLGAAAPWTAYADWEAANSAQDDPAGRRLRDLPPLGLGPRAGSHDGMRLGPIRRAPAPTGLDQRGLRAMGWFAAAFTDAAVALGLADQPVVALPMSFRRPTGARSAIGDFVDHLIVAPADPSQRNPDAVAAELRRQAAAPIPLRRRLLPLGEDRWRDPSPLTQAVVSYQPGTAVAPPFLLNLPGEAGGAALSRGEQYAPVFVPVTPLERQDVALLCSVFDGELRWRVSARSGLGLADDLDGLDAAVAGAVDALCRGAR